MSFPLRSENQVGWHHVMNRGVNRRSIFVRREDGQQFLDLLVKACARSSTTLHAYCLMSNHFHLLLECAEGGLSDTLHYVLSQYARWFNAVHGRDGHLFRGRFRSKHIGDEMYLAAVGRYIHRNPLDRADVADMRALRNYTWSSYGVYAGIRPAPPWLEVGKLRSAFGDERGYVAFVEGLTRAEVDRDWAVSTALMEVDVGDRSGGHLERTLNILLDLRLMVPVEQQLPFPSSAARRMAIARAQQRITEQPKLANVIDRAVELMAQRAA